jgi:hypothetical protein
VVVGDRVRPARLALLRQVDARLLIESQLDSAREKLGQGDLESQLIEVNVARLGDRAGEVQAFVAFLLPAPEVP